VRSRLNQYAAAAGRRPGQLGVVVVVVAAVLAACGGDPAPAPPAATTTPPRPPTATTVGPGPTPSESVVTGSAGGGSGQPTPTGTGLRITDDQAAKLLITPEDLPMPYQLDPTVTPDSRIGLPPGCAPLDSVTAAMRTAPVRAARGFVGGSVFPFLEERVAVLPQTAADQLAAFARALVSCRNFSTRDSDGVTTRFITSQLLTLDITDRPASDEVVALGMTGRSAPTSDAVSAQAVAVRRGDVLVLFVLSGLGKLNTGVLSAAVDKAAATLDRY
jgi:hypothetical protein